MRLAGVLVAMLAALPAWAAATTLVPTHIVLSDRTAFDLNIPAGYRLTPVAEGLNRVRFFARSPDGRLFVTDMHDLGDNTRGRVIALDGWDAASQRFTRVVPVLSNLRNPNSIDFHTDAKGRNWLYVALTQALVRYPYEAGTTAISMKPETLATFPDYGLSYKYGGWHLTRTVHVEADGTALVSVGSSCNACIEKEPVRASIIAIAPDGTQRTIARDLRNAVGLIRDGDALMATNQGADHLGHDAPDETLLRITDGMDAGWPYCYQRGGRVMADPKFPRATGCRGVRPAFAHFPAHASALGVVSMPSNRDASDVLAGHYIVALHGSTNFRIGHGYQVVRVSRDGRRVEPLITGFLAGGKVVGRPAGLVDDGAGGLFISDDRRGVVYHLERTR